MKNVFAMIGKGNKLRTENAELDMIRSADGDNDIAAALPFRYSDELFSGSACAYDHRLCVLSMGPTMSTFAFKGEGDAHVRKSFLHMGFKEDTILSRKFEKVKPISDTCAYAFATKKLSGSSDFWWMPITWAKATLRGSFRVTRKPFTVPTAITVIR